MHADADGAERRHTLIQFAKDKLTSYTVGRTEDQANLLAKIAHCTTCSKSGRGSNDLAQQAGVGVQQRLAVDVNDRDVVDVSPVAGIRLQQVIEIDVGLYVLGECALQGHRIAGIDDVLLKSGTALPAA